MPDIINELETFVTKYYKMTTFATLGVSHWHDSPLRRLISFKSSKIPSLSASRSAKIPRKMLDFLDSSFYEGFVSLCHGSTFPVVRVLIGSKA